MSSNSLKSCLLNECSNCKYMYVYMYIYIYMPPRISLRALRVYSCNSAYTHIVKHPLHGFSNIYTVVLVAQPFWPPLTCSYLLLSARAEPAKPMRQIKIQQITKLMVSILPSHIAHTHLHPLALCQRCILPLCACMSLGACTKACESVRVSAYLLVEAHQMCGAASTVCM